MLVLNFDTDHNQRTYYIVIAPDLSKYNICVTRLFPKL